MTVTGEVARQDLRTKAALEKVSAALERDYREKSVESAHWLAQMSRNAAQEIDTEVRTLGEAKAWLDGYEQDALTRARERQQRPAQTRALPTLRVPNGASFYFDERLQEFRDTTNPHRSFPLKSDEGQHLFAMFVNQQARRR